MNAHSTQHQFLDPITVVGNPAVRQQLETVSGWLKAICDSIGSAVGTRYRPVSPGVSTVRFGWDDLRRVFYASRFEKIVHFDAPAVDCAVAYIALRDGRLVGIHADFCGDTGLDGPVAVYLWSREDWDAFMVATASFTDGGGDDEALRAHVALCGTVID